METFINSQEDWVLVDCYYDEGKSGTTRNGREGYNRLFEDMLENKFDIIVIKDQSRLMRNVLDWYLFVDRLNRTKKKLYLYLDHTFYTPDDALITGIKAMMAEEYSRDLSRKILSAAKRSQKGGTVYGNNRLWGYDQKDGKLFINEEEAEVVRFVFSSYISGNGFRKIVTQLDDMGIKSSTGTIFSISVLKRMIRNEKYKGVLVGGKTHKDFYTKKLTFTDEDEWIVIPGGVPAIVSEEIWEQANRILNERRMKKIESDKGATKEVYIGHFAGPYCLSGKMRCGVCGEIMWHTKYFTKAHVRRDTWVCRRYKMYGKDTKRGCNARIVFEKDIIPIIKTCIFEALSNEKVAIKKVIANIKLAAQKNAPALINENVNQRVRSLKQKRGKILDLYIDGTLNKYEYKTKKDEIDSLIEELERKQDENPDVEEIIRNQGERLDKLQKILASKFESPETLPDSFIRNFVYDVTVYNDKIKISLYDGSEYMRELIEKNTIKSDSKNQKNDDFQLVSNSVQQRTGNALQIALNGIGRAAARAGGVPKIAAWAGIHPYPQFV